MQGTTLLLVALPLVALESGEAPSGLGAKGHGWITRLLARREPSAAHHHGNQRSRLLVSPLLRTADGLPPGNLVEQVASGDCYWLRLVLAGEQAKSWSRLLRPALVTQATEGTPVRLGPVGGASGTVARWYRLLPPPWPEQTHAFADFLHGECPERWGVQLLSPASFQPALPAEARADAPAARYQPLPAPELLLRPLSATWADWDPPGVATRAEVERLARYVQIERAELAVRLLPVPSAGGGAWGPAGEHAPELPATLGWLVLRCLPEAKRAPGWQERDQERRALLAALLRLAPFAGIGEKTSLGMGMVATRPLRTEDA